jgi:maltose O-acetyltransferase
MVKANQMNNNKSQIIKKVMTFASNILHSYLYMPEDIIIRNGGKVGNSVYIGKGVLIDYDYAFLLEIGDGAVIAARTIIELHDSSLPNVLGNGKLKVGTVKIGTRAYIGVNSVILPGVEIGPSAIVGACSLVTKNIPEMQVWAGVPARFICTVEELREKRRSTDNRNIKHFDWFDEQKKHHTDYGKVKEEFLRTVKREFK